MPRIMGARELQTSNPTELPNEAIVLGPHHNPIGHRDFACGMATAIDAAGLNILEQEHVVDGVRSNMGRHGNYGDITIPQANIFSLFTVEPKSASTNLVAPTGSRFLIGARNSVAMVLAAQACVGIKFPICTNISLFGENILFKRKNTTNANIGRLMLESLCEKVLPMLRTAEEQLEALRAVNLSLVQREATIFRLLRDGALPTKMLKALGEAVESNEYPEVMAERGNALGVMHAATRVIQEVKSLRRQAEMSQAISRFFHFGSLN